MIEFYGKGDVLMEAAFVSCVHWAWRRPEMRREFEDETGMKLAESGIDSLIDEATGYDKEVMEAFVEWVIANVWGKA